MTRTSTTAAAALILSGFIGAAEGQESATAPGVVSLRECRLEYERTSQVGAIVDSFYGDSSSILQDCLVNLGDRVKTDQVLGRLQYRTLLTDLGTAQAQADNQLFVRSNEANYKLAKYQAQQAAKLLEKRAISLTEYTQLVCAEKVAAIAIDQAKFDIEMAKLRAQRYKAKLRNVEFRAPHDGVVVEIPKHEGERVNIGDMGFLVVDDSHVLVTGQLDIADVWNVHPGQQARVMPEIEGVDLPIEQEVFDGKVIFVDNRIDPQNITGVTVPFGSTGLPPAMKTMTCKVIVRVANRDNLLRSGLFARMEILPRVETAKATPERSLPTPTSTSARVSGEAPLATVSHP